VLKTVKLAGRGYSNGISFHVNTKFDILKGLWKSRPFRDTVLGFLRDGLIVVRAGEGMRVEAYDNLDLFRSFWVKPKRTKKSNGHI
jgi:hypothetical protein